MEQKSVTSITQEIGAGIAWLRSHARAARQEIAAQRCLIKLYEAAMEGRSVVECHVPDECQNEIELTNMLAERFGVNATLKAGVQLGDKTSIELAFMAEVQPGTDNKPALHSTGEQ